MTKRSPVIPREVHQFMESVENPVFMESALRKAFDTNRSNWQLSDFMTFSEFFKLLWKEKVISQITLESELYPSIVRYAYGKVTEFQVALSMKPRSFLSHGTAVFLHGLTDQIPRAIYVNQEQSPKPKPTMGISQERIRLAYSRPQRTSRYAFRFGDHRIILVNGKSTNRMGVMQTKGPSGELLDVTSIERTLIDIIVRPAYAGGIFQVLDAYKAAKDRVNPREILRILSEMDYVYPFHQSVGFLMERAGYEASSTLALRERGLNFDFYLVHGARELDYEKSWRLYFPKGV
jgi:predicted transcriptional regulator of viral defense system